MGGDLLMLWLRSTRHAVVMVLVTFWLGISYCYAAEPSGSVTAGIGGVIKLIIGDHIVPVKGARIEVAPVLEQRDKYDSVTDETGKYTLEFPQGTYSISLFWMGGECSKIRRASVSLKAGEHLDFDFLVMSCPDIVPIKAQIQFEGASINESVQLITEAMNIPFSKQTEKYQERAISAQRGHWPEIIVSFGKYDNRVDEILFFPLHQVVINRPTITPPPIPLSLPVTITVDRYTLRGSEVVWDKKTMTFRAKGEVSVSDGKQNITGASATLSFPVGLPKLEIDH